jgi:hypothetical protein
MLEIVNGRFKTTLKRPLYLRFWHLYYDISGALDLRKPEKQFEIWASIKFEGPAYPYGKKEDENAVSIERVVLIKK